MRIEEFLEARITEDEIQAAKHQEAASRYGWGDYTGRILQECAAKRAILKSYNSCRDAEHLSSDLGPKLVASGMTTGLGIALKCLAATYCGHSDYDEAWAKA